MIIRYHATSDMDTICSLTNHSYFNLAGYDTGPVYDQEIQIHASRFTPSDPHAIPIGTLAPVADTPMDFLHYTRIGQRIDPRETAAVGDSEEDIAMFRTCGYGIAVKEGSLKAAAEADFITECSPTDIRFHTPAPH